jgi:hypothetical protein
MRVAPGAQLTLELQPGLLRRYASLRDCLHHSVLNDARGLKAVAADCDLSVSELSRRLHPSDEDPRSCDVNLMVRIIESTGDLAPLHWLNARFLADEPTRYRSAVDQLVRMLPEIKTVLENLGAKR